MTVDPTLDLEPLALEALLRWYVAMGVDATISDTPRDCFAGPNTSSAVRFPADASTRREIESAGGTPSAGPVKASAGPPSSAAALVAEAEALAAGAETLADLQQRWASVPGCGLAATATCMIFAGGAPGARLMLVGGAPDSDDERQGDAFAGAKGRLLDAMLRAIGLDRGQVYLANVLPWRPPGNRQPTPLELNLCLPFAKRQIELAAPAALICLGERAAQPLLGTRDPISRLRGRWMQVETPTTTAKTLVTFSLDYLLKQPLQKRRAWADLLMVSAELGR